MTVITALFTSMTCVKDVSDISLEGKNGVKNAYGKSLTVSFKRCKEPDPAPAEPRCKSDAEID